MFLSTPLDSRKLLGLSASYDSLGAVIITKDSKMLRAILAAMANGLRKAFGFAFSIFTWPFRLFMPSARPSMPTLDMAAIKQAKADVATSGMKATELAQSQMRDSQIVWSWVMNSLLTNTTQPLPSALSRTMQSWLQGLDHAQLVALKNAGPQGVFEHAAGKKALSLVPPVKPLAPITIKYPAPKIQKSDAEIAELKLTPA